MKCFYLPIAIILTYTQGIYTQNRPSFHKFSGTVYHIERENVKLGYGTHVYSYEQIQEVTWDSLYFPEGYTQDGFPGIISRSSFGVILHSEMEIAQEGCYSFSLHSDDGSKLWIDKKLVLDNGGAHKMRFLADTFQMDPGIYPIRVWYMQAFPDRYGLILKGEQVSDSLCLQEFESLVPANVLGFDNAILFEYDSHALKPEAKSLINNAYRKIVGDRPTNVRIEGHTDNIGSEEYNLRLSQKRAETIDSILGRRLRMLNINVMTIGKGSSEPRASNDTEEGRARNRRVEIIIDY